MLGSKAAAGWLRDVQQTSYIIQCSADRLQTDRERCSATTNEWDGILSEQETKLVKHFSRILFLQYRHRAAIEDQDETLGEVGFAAHGSLRAWLKVVNLQPKAVTAIESAVQSLIDLLNLNERSLAALCELVDVDGENRRRFVTATRNLSHYTNRWIALGREPIEEFSDADLSWFSYERRLGAEAAAAGASSATASGGSNFLASGNDRRSVSESGVDSGASDSGVGSNVSQTSLPTTTPPASPGCLLAPQVAVRPGTSTRTFDWFLRGPTALKGATTSSGGRFATPRTNPPTPVVGAVRKATPKAASSTPPPTLKWGTSQPKTDKLPASPTTAEGLMPRSRSHESNLPYRIIKDPLDRSAGCAFGYGGSKQMTLPQAMSRSVTEGSSMAGARRHGSSSSASSTGGGGIAPPISTPTASGSGQSRLVSPDPPSYGGLLSPTSPTVSGSFFAQTPTSSPAQLFHPRSASTGGSGLTAPKSPRTGRLMHSIPHVWKKRSNLRHLTDKCQVCRRPLGIMAFKCRSCKLNVHTDCKEKLGERTCGLKPEHLRAMVMSVLPNDDAWGERPNPSLNGSRSTNFISEIASTPTTTTAGPFTYADSLESSSSTNSSAPSTPAQTALASGGIRSPYVPICKTSTASSTKFLFPEVPELPDIVLPESDTNIIGSQDSDGSTVRINSRGSGPGTGSERTLSQDDTLTDSVGSQQSGNGNLVFPTSASESGMFTGVPPHNWDRRNWAQVTVRQPSSSLSAWRDVTIPFDKIQFGADSLIGRGRFGAVHRGYYYQPVAVKLLNMDHVEDAIQLETFKQEVASFKNTRHENIVLFVGYCLDPPKLGIVMNYCKGRTLHNVLHHSRETVEMSRIVHISAQICQGMSYLHTKRILHKDLRTKNIFLEGTDKGSGPVSDKRRLDKVVITDFGLFSMRRLCKLQENQSECKSLHVPEQWLCYLSPEMMRCLTARRNGDELPFSFASDAYAFGTVWYELLTGEFPFKRYPAETIVWQVGRGIKPPLNNIHVAREIKEIPMQCWAYEPDKRPDFNELLKTLERLPKKRLARSPSHPIKLSRSAEAIF